MLDASRAVGVVSRTAEQSASEAEARRRERELQQPAARVSTPAGASESSCRYAEARANGLQTRLGTVDIADARFTGARVLDDVPLAELVPVHRLVAVLLDLGTEGQVPGDFRRPEYGDAASELFDDAQALLDRIVDEKLLRARGVYGFWPANSDGDDIIVYTDESRTQRADAFHSCGSRKRTPRGKPIYSLADFIAPARRGRKITSAPSPSPPASAATSWRSEFEREHDDYNAIMAKALADRLAEAFAEYLHAQARARLGLRRDEKLSPRRSDRRKIPRHPPRRRLSRRPDHTEKQAVRSARCAERAASRSPNCAMTPAASVSGLYFAHPAGPLLQLDRISRDQVEDYAGRKAPAGGRDAAVDCGAYRRPGSGDSHVTKTNNEKGTTPGIFCRMSLLR